MFSKGGGFKVRPASRCTSAIRKSPTKIPQRESEILNLYGVNQGFTINQFRSPTQQNSSRFLRPTTAVRSKFVSDEDSTQEYEAGRKHKHVKMKTTYQTYRLNDKPSKLSTRGQLETIVDSLLKKSNTTITQEEEKRSKQPAITPYDILQKTNLNLKVTRSSSQNIIVDTHPSEKDQQQTCPIGGLERYMITSVLGTGSYAVVKLARDKLTERLVAIKTYMKSRLHNQQRKQSLKREIHILKHLEHENIVQFVGIIESPNEIHLVTEYGGSSSLRTYLRSFPTKSIAEDQVKTLFKQIVKAVEYCHSQNIVHRDIKLENVLLKDNSHIKLVDFGFSVMVTKEAKLSVFCGTPSYMAPELVNKIEYYGKPVDVWALGVLLYVLLTGVFPFKGKDDTELYGCIRKGIYKMPQVSVQCQKLISQMLTIRPTERITSARIVVDKWLNS